MAAARGVTVKDVSSPDFVAAYARHLKRSGKIDVPKWADLVKTGAYKELAPTDPDWYYIRAGRLNSVVAHHAASMARRLYVRGGVGVGAFCKIYGGRNDKSVRPSHFAKASGAVA